MFFVLNTIVISSASPSDFGRMANVVLLKQTPLKLTPTFRFNGFPGPRRNHLRFDAVFPRQAERISFVSDNRLLRLDEKNAPRSIALDETVRANRFDRIRDAIVQIWKKIKGPVLAAIVVGALFVCYPRLALAASGGRMGGRLFSESPPPESSSSSSYSSSFGGYSRPTSLVDSEYFFSDYYYRRPLVGTVRGAFVDPVVGVTLSAVPSVTEHWMFPTLGAAGALSMLFLAANNNFMPASVSKTSVLEVQVGLLGAAHPLQRDLNRIAKAIDTSSPQGLHYTLTETLIALLRHPHYWFSAYSCAKVMRSVDDGEKYFNQLSMEEREKFDEETLVNVDGIRTIAQSTNKDDAFLNQYVVITILVAARGEHKLPVITCDGDLKNSLERLASISTRNILAVEVLWTPQDEEDTLSEQELALRYPLLRIV